MKKSKLVLTGFINSVGVFAYVSLVAWLMFNAQTFFGKDDNVLAPVLMLLLFVLSATITGLLVLGKPTHLYLGGFKKEAFILLFSTLAWLLLFIVGVVIVLLFR